jgi:uncharacterized protein YfaS (alpha-2-macroglobulin family)
MSLRVTEQIKVQGSINVCVNTLRNYAQQYNVSYDIHIGESPTQKTQQTIQVGNNQTTKIPIYLMWRSTYNEYDNSY